MFYKLAVVAVFCLSFSFFAVLSSGYSGPDLPPGPYCGARPDSCCQGREDRCSAPILGTLCYCDDFCNRTVNDDCCPDFWSFCHGVEPPPENIITCYHNGKYMEKGQKVSENCNDCTCTDVNGNAEIVCDSDPCMIQEELIDAINNDQSVTWRATNYSTFWGHKLKEGLKYRTGTLMPQRSTRGMHPLRPIYDPHSMPPSFNTLQNWPGKLAPIQDQGWCGSSWAVATAAVASDKFVIMSKGRESPLLSAQQLISCNNRGQKSCSGGYLDRAWQFSRKFGLVNEDCYPYTGKEEACKMQMRGTLLSSGCSLPNDSSGRKSRYHVSPAYKLGNETDIMYELMNSGPAQATMRVYQDFFSYKGGVYRHVQKTDVQDFTYHSVRLMGWGTENGIKYWLAANSWGEKWGERGFFRILRGQNECEIESYVIGAWANTVREKNEIAAAYRARPSYRRRA